MDLCNQINSTPKRSPPEPYVQLPGVPNSLHYCFAILLSATISNPNARFRLISLFHCLRRLLWPVTQLSPQENTFCAGDTSSLKEPVEREQPVVYLSKHDANGVKLGSTIVVVASAATIPSSTNSSTRPSSKHTFRKRPSEPDLLEARGSFL